MPVKEETRPLEEFERQLKELQGPTIGQPPELSLQPPPKPQARITGSIEDFERELNVLRGRGAATFEEFRRQELNKAMNLAAQVNTDIHIFQKGFTYTEEERQRLGVPVTTIQQTANINLARQFYNDTRTMEPAYQRTAGVGALQRISERHEGYARLVPFVGAALEVGDLLRILELAKKEEAGKELSQDEKILLNSFAAYTHARNNFDPGFLDRSVEMAVEMAPYVLEFAATSGLYALGRKGGTKGVQWLIERAVGRRITGRAFEKLARREAGERVAMTLGERAITAPARVGGFLLGGAVQAPAMPEFLSETVRRQLPEYRLAESVLGQQISRELDEAGEDFWTALTKAYGLTAVETITERTGGAVSWIQHRLKRRFLQRFLAKRGITEMTPRVRGFIQRMGWNGLVGEIFEEELAKPFRNMIEGDPTLQGVLDPGELAVEALAIGLFGGAVGTLGYGTSAVGRRYQARQLRKFEQEQQQAEDILQEAARRYEATAPPALRRAMEGLPAALRTLEEQRREEDRLRFEIRPPPERIVELEGEPRPGVPILRGRPLSREEREQRRIEEAEKRARDLLAEERERARPAFRVIERRRLVLQQEAENEHDEQLARARDLRLLLRNPALTEEERARIESERRELRRGALEAGRRARALIAEEEPSRVEERPAPLPAPTAEVAELRELSAEEQIATLQEDSNRLQAQRARAQTEEDAEQVEQRVEENRRLLAELQADRRQAIDQQMDERRRPQQRKEGEAIAGIRGQGTVLRTVTQNLQATYWIVESDQLKTSHDPANFTPTKGYPEGVQERDYHRDRDAQLAVIDHTQNFDPSFLITDAPGPEHGPPMVTPDGIVVGGNSRAMSIARLYGEGRGEEYRGALIENAGRYGFVSEREAEQFQGMRQPVLVRVIADAPTELNQLRALASDLNRVFTRKLSEYEQAVSAGKRISPETLEWVGGQLAEMGEEASLRDLLRERSNAVLERLQADGVIAPTERRAFIDEQTGGLNDPGKDFFENVLLGAVIDDANILANTPKSILKKIERALPAIARIRARGGAWDITDYIKESLGNYISASTRGISIGEYYNPPPALPGMERPAPHPITEGIGRKLEQKVGQVKTAFDSYATDAERDVRAQTTLGFFQVRQPWESFADYFGVKVDAAQWGTVAREERLEGEVSPPSPTIGLREEITPPPAPVSPVITPPSQAAPPISDVYAATTGEAFVGTLLQGTGRADIGAAYGEGAAAVPILGKGRYTTPSREFALFFGPDVREVQVRLDNPLVIETDVQWRALTQRAGWEYPNPVRYNTAGKQKAREEISRMRAMLEREGYDGLVVRVSRSIEDEAKTLRKVFGDDTVVEFRPQEGPPPALVRPEEAVEASRQRLEEERKGYGNRNLLFTKERMEEARRRLLGKAGRLQAGVDPTMLRDLIEIGGYHFEAGLREFGAWSRRVIIDTGAWAAPHLRRVWTELRSAASQRATETTTAVPPQQREAYTRQLGLFAEIPTEEVPRAEPPPPEQLRALPYEARPGEEPRRIGAPPEPTRAAEPPTRAPGRRVRGEPRGRPGDRRVPQERALERVAPIRIDEPTLGVVKSPIIGQEVWQQNLRKAGLPEAIPPPTETLSPEVDRVLRFVGQPEVAQTALTGLRRYGGAVVAASTGTGKTYISGAILKEENPEFALVLTKNQALVNKSIEIYRNDFGIDARTLPAGATAPPGAGVYVTTYQTAIARKGIETFPWGLVVADESGEARRWYEGGSQQGAMLQEMSKNAAKVLYMSATPFHTPLELGYMEKLGLWQEEGFGTWAAQFGVRYDAYERKWISPLAPRKLAKLRAQLIERGQMIDWPRDMRGFSVDFSIVPLTEDQRRGIGQINAAYELAERYFERHGLRNMIMAAKGNRVTYTKNFLERSRLHAAIEIGKKLEQQGWRVIFFSENKKEVTQIHRFLEDADAWSGGEISRLIPPLPGVIENLQAAFGDQLANYSGKHSRQRTQELRDFNEGRKRILYATYGAGGMGVDMHDQVGDAPRAAIYLGPPWSGILFDQAIGRPWRFGTRSNVHGIFLLSDSKAEIDLVVQKVYPRVAALRAIISGIEEGDPIVQGLLNAEKFVDEAYGYEFGGKHKADPSEFVERVSIPGIHSYKEATIPAASEAMNKGMLVERRKLPGEPPPSPLTTLYSGIDPSLVMRTLRDLFRRRKPEEPRFANPSDQGKWDAALRRMREIVQDQELQLGIREGDKLSDHEKELFTGIVEARAQQRAEERGTDLTTAVMAEWDEAAEFMKAAQWIPGEMGRLQAFNLYVLTNSREAIRRVGGQHGREIAEDIIEYHIQKGNISGPWVNRLVDIVTGNQLTPEQFANAFLAVEGKQKPSAENVSKAVGQLRELMAEVARFARQVGVMVEIIEAGGRRRYVDFPEEDPSYMPHKLPPDVLLKKSEQKRRAIIRSLMTKYNISREEAERRLGQMGFRDVALAANMERPRETDVEGYLTDMAAVAQYLEEAGEVIARTRVFGQRRGKLEVKINRISQDIDPRSAEFVEEIMDSFLAKGPRSRDAENFYRLAGNWAIWTKMWFSAIPNMSQGINGVLFTNLDSTLRAFSYVSTNWEEARRLAIDAGAILEQTHAELMKEFTGEARRRARGPTRERGAHPLLKRTGFLFADEFGRAISVATARIYLTDHVLPAFKENPQDAVLRQHLRENFSLSDQMIDQAIGEGYWSRETLARAGKRLSDDTQFTFDPTELPPAWRALAKHPVANYGLALLRAITVLKSYAFKQGALLKRAVYDEAKRGNFRPLMRVAIFYPVVGEIVGNISRAVRGDFTRVLFWLDDENYEPAKLFWRYLENWSWVGGVGILHAFIDSLRWGWDLLRTFAGPMYSDWATLSNELVNFVGAISRWDGKQAAAAVVRAGRQIFVPARVLVPSPSELGLTKKARTKLKGMAPPPMELPPPIEAPP